MNRNAITKLLSPPPLWDPGFVATSTKIPRDPTLYLSLVQRRAGGLVPELAHPSSPGKIIVRFLAAFRILCLTVKVVFFYGH